MKIFKRKIFKTQHDEDLEQAAIKRDNDFNRSFNPKEKDWEQNVHQRGIDAYNEGHCPQCGRTLSIDNSYVPGGWRWRAYRVDGEIKTAMVPTEPHCTACERFSQAQE